MNRKFLVAVAAGALALPMGAQVQADEMAMEPHGHDVDGKVAIEVSGHVNRALVFHDLNADTNNDPDHQDAGSSGSRYRFKGSKEMENGLTAGVNLEYGLTGNLRHAAVSVGGEVGTVTLGHTGPATHIISHVSNSPVAFLGGVEIGCDFCGAGGGHGEDVFNYVHSHAFGAGRREIVKFESVDLGGANISVSGDFNDFWDVALRASGESGSVAYTFNAGFTSYAEVMSAAVPASNLTVKGSDVMAVLEKENVTLAEHLEANNDAVLTDLNSPATPVLVVDPDTYYNKYTPLKKAGVMTREYEATSLAAAVKFAQGTHFDVAWTSMEPDMGQSQESTHFGVGHILPGGTDLAATYTNSGFAGGGNSWAVGIGHHLGGNVEVYASYKALEFDVDTVEDYGLFVIGSRVLFN